MCGEVVLMEMRLVERVWLVVWLECRLEGFLVAWCGRKRLAGAGPKPQEKPWKQKKKKIKELKGSAMKSSSKGNVAKSQPPQQSADEWRLRPEILRL